MYIIIIAIKTIFSRQFTLTFFELNLCFLKWHKKVYPHLLNSLSNSTFCIHLWEPPLVDQQSRLLTVEPYYYQRQLVATKRGPTTSLFDYSFEIITKYHVNSCGNISLLSAQSPIGFMRINAVEPKSILFDICFSSKLFSIILIESEPDLYRLEQMAVSCEIYFFALYFNQYKLVCR